MNHPPLQGDYGAGLLVSRDGQAHRTVGKLNAGVGMAEFVGLLGDEARLEQGGDEEKESRSRGHPDRHEAYPSSNHTGADCKG